MRLVAVHWIVAESTLESEPNVDPIKKPNIVPFDHSSNDDEPAAVNVAQNQYGKRTSQQDVLWDRLSTEKGFL